MDTETIPTPAPSPPKEKVRKRRKAKYRPKNKNRKRAKKQDGDYVPPSSVSASDDGGSESDGEIPDELDMLNPDTTELWDLFDNYKEKLKMLSPAHYHPLAEALIRAKELATMDVWEAQRTNEWSRVSEINLRLWLAGKVLDVPLPLQGTPSSEVCRLGFNVAYVQTVNEIPLEQHGDVLEPVVAIDYEAALRFSVFALQCTYMSCFDAQETWPDEKHVVFELSELGPYMPVDFP